MVVEYKIIWSKRAEKGYDRIVKHLEKEWTAKEVSHFVMDTHLFFKLLKKNPYMLQKSEERKNVYRGPINKLTILTYRLKPRKHIIELVNIRGARQKPLKK
jgi:plasmid stabilization system protein ParE